MSAGAQASSGVEVRACCTLAEFAACMEIERRVWGSADLDVVPLPIFVVAAETGGQVLGAFRDDRMVGFTLALAAFREARPALHSHMTAVLAEERDQGVGQQLKRFQRQEALDRGIELVEWTFDPLELKNAYFNLERLGAIACAYLPNLYGRTTSPLHAGLPTDRLLAEWWLRSPRVEARLSGPAEPRRVAGETVRIGVPAHIGEWKRERPEEAARVQGAIREEFLEWFARGYGVTGFRMGSEQGEYLLERVANPEAIR